MTMEEVTQSNLVITKGETNVNIGLKNIIIKMRLASMIVSNYNKSTRFMATL